MKTYLPIEGMPKGCFDCSLVNDCRYSKRIILKDGCITYSEKERGKDCPLRQMPDREEAKDILLMWKYFNEFGISEVLLKLGYKEDK